MDFSWITDDHIHALIEGLARVEEPYRSRLREVLVAVNSLHMEALGDQITDAIAQHDTPFEQQADVVVVETLLSKGLMHNGIVPTMSMPEVARAADLVAQVISRVRVGTLTFEEQDLLDWVFDQGANAYEQANYHPVRNLERRVRGGLGLDARIAFLPNLPHDPA